MSPAEASNVIYEEPDWKEEFEIECARWPRLPRYLQEDSAFESILKRWRRWHKADDKPAPASDGMIALAKLKIFPTRFHGHEIPRGGEPLQQQHDDQCWITMSQRAWRIVGIEDGMLFLDSFGDKTQVSLEPRKWIKWSEKALEALREQWPHLKK